MNPSKPASSPRSQCKKPAGASAHIHRLEPYHFTRNLPPDVRDKLKDIFANWSDDAYAEARVREIIEQAPDSLGIRIVAYRFYFYRRRSQEAANWALACLEWLSERMGLPADWRCVAPNMADFNEWHAFPRLWLQSLTAYAYNLARLGRRAESLAALAKVEELDPSGRLGAAKLREVFIAPDPSAGMVLPKPFETWSPGVPGTASP